MVTISDRRVWLTAYAPLIIWTIVVIGLGTGVGTSTETSRFIRPFLELLFPDATTETLAVYHGAIRKFAHFFEYGVFAALAFRAFLRIDALRERPALWAIAFVVLIASIDEFNQSFNTRRTGTIFDVLLDAAGGVFGLLSYWVVRRQRNQTPVGPSPER